MTRSIRVNSVAPNCIFESPTPVARDTARLLLVSYHFPPGQAAGALRWQKLAIHGAARGWAFDVIALDPASLGSADPSRLGNLPPGTRIFGVDEPTLAVQRLENAAWRLYQSLRSKSARNDADFDASAAVESKGDTSFLRDEVSFQPLSIRSWMRSYEAWLDFARTGAWARRAAALGRQLATPGVYRGIVSCGPPHMSHEGARQLARATGLPLIIDLRDPWCLAERLSAHMASPIWYRYAARYESLVVREAALIVMNTEPAQRAMSALHPEQAARIITVNNGYDEDEPLPTETRDGRFLLAFAGSIYADRNPRALFEAAGRIVRELELSPADFGIALMGPQMTGDPSQPLRAMAEHAGVERFLQLHPPGTVREAAKFLARATVLVNLPQDSHLAIPSKIFEYMRYAARLLALAERDSATELLLRGTEADVVSPEDIEALVEVLRRGYTDHVAGRRPEPIACERFSRRAQAERIFGAIEAIAGEP